MQGVNAASAQVQRQAGTLVIAGQPEQTPLVRIDGRSYVDLESLARMTHGTLRFDGTRTILTLPGALSGSSLSPSPGAGNPPPGLTQSFLNAQIAALAQVREWHAALVTAVNNNIPVTDALLGPIRRQGDAKLQLALAAATSAPDHQAAALLRNEFANIQQMTDQFLQMSAQATHISPDVFTNNALDAKIMGCQNALAQLAGTKQFQDDAQCH
ncbi:MAG TPA: hypothetical protein VII58_03515 [Acidobacteriaceae bacterium]